MLRSLYIKDIILIKEIEINFSDGLNIITGETGTGKSIIVNSINYITGEKSSPDIVRKDAVKGIIEAVFDVSDIPELKERFKDLLFDDELILRREIYASGRSRNFINDTPCNLSDLKDAGKYLIDLHGQHQHQSLLYPENYSLFIDRFGNFTNLSNDIKVLINDFRAKYNKREKLKRTKKDFENRKELLEFQFKEINKINISEEEEKELENEINILENSEKLFDLTSRIYIMLYESEDSIANNLATVLNQLDELVFIDSSFKNSIKEIDSARIICTEVANLMRDYKSHIEFNAEKLENLRLRMQDINMLKKKYGGSIKDILRKKEEINEELDRDFSLDKEIERLNNELSDISGKLIKKAEQLAEKRKNIKSDMEKLIEERLRILGIKDAVFKIEIKKRDKVNNFSEEFDEINYIGEDGIDDISFLISTIKIVEPKPLLKIASGGEISRIMLALKSVLSDADDIPVMVFDEIDIGISGRIAAVVGNELKNLAKNRQIVCITHLPQIAVKGKEHFSIKKYETVAETESSINKLTFRDRIEELARLIGGEKLTEINLLNAEEMLKKEDG